MRYDFIKMIEEYDDQDSLAAFRTACDGTVNFKIIDDNTVVAGVSGQEKITASAQGKDLENV